MIVRFEEICVKHRPGLNTAPFSGISVQKSYLPASKPAACMA